MTEIYMGFHIIRMVDGMWGVFDCGKIVAKTYTRMGARRKIRMIVRGDR